MERNDPLKDQRIELNYPCDWEYRVIGISGEVLQSAVNSVFQAHGFDFKLSNMSKNGKYQAAIIETRVENESIRQEFFENLKAHPDIKLVL